MDPLLKWVGGKRWQVPMLKRIWAKYRTRRLVEPFCGALSVTLGLEPDRALCNDSNPHLINLYRQVQQGLEYDLGLSTDDYAHNREWFNALIREGLADTKEAANLFWYLNRFGFNGLCRFNASGEFNVPVGKGGRDIAAPSYRAMRLALLNVELRCGDWRGVPIEEGDFIYADPPYDDGFTTYTGTAFTWQDQEDLALVIGAAPCPALLCNLATDRILELYQRAGLCTLIVEAPRRVSANGDRSPVKEVIASNFPVDPSMFTGLGYALHS